MAKKRKLISKATESQKQKQQKQEQEEQEQKEQQLAEQIATQEQLEEEEDDEEDADYEVVGEEDGEEEEEEEEEEGEEEDGEDEEEEDEEEGEEEEEEEADDEAANGVGDDDGEPIHTLLEPFTKEKLLSMICEAAEKHPQVAARVRKIADEDPVNRKIFVHGLGWDTTTETLRGAFSQYGDIEDCKAVTDKISGKSKGYGFILFKSRSGAYKALQEPQKKIGNRITACQLAAVGPVPASNTAGGSGSGSGSAQPAAPQQPVSEYTQRKIYVSNVGENLDPQKLYNFFANFGEIEEGPLGLDKVTGKPKGFCLFVYKSVESARKALEEPHKAFEGHILNCQKAIDGPKHTKQHHLNQPQRNPHYGRNDNQSYGGPVGGGQMMGQAVSTLPYNQGAAAPALNPALGQALTALLASQGGLGLHNLLGSLGTAGVGAAPAVAPAVHGIQGGYGNQAVGSSISPGVLGGYGTQAGLQGAYQNQQQGGSRTQHGAGHMGGGAPYTGH